MKSENPTNHRGIRTPFSTVCVVLYGNGCETSGGFGWKGSIAVIVQCHLEERVQVGALYVAPLSWRLSTEGTS